MGLKKWRFLIEARPTAGLSGRNQGHREEAVTDCIYRGNRDREVLYLLSSSHPIQSSKSASHRLNTVGRQLRGAGEYSMQRSTLLEEQSKRSDNGSLWVSAFSSQPDCVDSRSHCLHSWETGWHLLGEFREKQRSWNQAWKLEATNPGQLSPSYTDEDSLSFPQVGLQGRLNDQGLSLTLLTSSYWGPGLPGSFLHGHCHHYNCCW